MWEGRISKTKLLQRLERRSRLRYGGGFAESWYDTLTDSGLIAGLERGPNNGLAPTYFATRAHYRRALQLKRIHARGITRREAQLVQLFVRGYSVEPHQVPAALRQELIRALTRLRPMLRSAYFQNFRDVGPKHLASIAKQMGPLDDRFVAAGLKQPTEFLLRIMRAGFRSGSGEFEGKTGGLLLAGAESEPLPDFIEAALQFNPDRYLKVRTIFAITNQFLFKGLVGDGLLNSPEFTACAFAAMLVADHGGFTVSDLSVNLPAPQGFEALVAGVCDVITRREKNSKR